MKRKIISFLLVATMLMTYSPFAFAEDLDLGDSSGVEIENIEKNDALIGNEQVGLGVEELDANQEQISSDPVYEVNDDTEIIEGDLGVVEGSEEPSEPNEVTTPSPDKNRSEEASEEDTEQLDDEFGVDDGFGVDSEENIDSAFGVDSGESNIGSLEDEDEGLSSDNVYIDPTQDDSGYVVIETPEDAYEGLDIDGPTATEEDPEEAVDPGFTISAEEEAKGQEIAREPLIFKTYDGMTLYRRENGTIAAADYTCTNNTGVDVYLVGVEVIPINGWEMVGYEVDFKNMKSDTREFRLTVNNQVILDYDGDGFIPMYDPEIFFEGEEICIPMDLEIGPFKNGLNEGLFTFVLVFEEIIKEDPVEETKEETQESLEGTQEESKEVETESEVSTEETENENKESEDIINNSQEEQNEDEDVGADNINEEDTPSVEADEEITDDSSTNNVDENAEEGLSDLPVLNKTENVSEPSTLDIEETELLEEVDNNLVVDEQLELPASVEEDISANLEDVQIVQVSAELADMESQVEPSLVAEMDLMSEDDSNENEEILEMSEE